MTEQTAATAAETCLDLVFQVHAETANALLRRTTTSQDAREARRQFAEQLLDAQKEAAIMAGPPEEGGEPTAEDYARYLGCLLNLVRLM